MEKGLNQEEIDAIKLYAVNVGAGRGIEHLVEAKWRFGVRTLANKSRPGGVVKLGVIVCAVCHGLLH